MSLQLNTGTDDNEHQPVHEINVTPFIDVILVLLIIFMVAAPLATVDINVDLPSSSAEKQDRPDKPLFLTLKKDQSIFLNDQPITMSGIKEKLDAVTQGDKEQRIFLRADKTVEYSDLMSLMNALRAAGYLKIALVGIEVAGTESVGNEDSAAP